MIARVDEVRSAWRWYHMVLTNRARPFAPWDTARRAASYACGSLAVRAFLGRPTEHGPHEFAQVMLWQDLIHNHGINEERYAMSWYRSSLRLLSWEAELLCSELGLVYGLAKASEMSTLARLTLEDAVIGYDPVTPQWYDGFLHTSEQQLAKGILHRIELAMDDPDAPAADWDRLGREYADGELHRHLGWTQRPEAQEGDQDGQQAATVRSERLPDQARTDDQVEGQRPDRDSVPGESPRPGAHHPHADHD